MYIEKHHEQTKGQTTNWENICSKHDLYLQYEEVIKNEYNSQNCIQLRETEKPTKIA